MFRVTRANRRRDIEMMESYLVKRLNFDTAFTRCIHMVSKVKNAEKAVYR